MGVCRFDRKFGVDFLRELPERPGVYLFKDDAGEVLYVGKARNLRRRLAQYRNAGRRKVHRKMRELVRVAHALEVRPEASETEALLRENELIGTLRPRYNVDGAYAFLYPAIGIGGEAGQTWLCIASQPEAYAPLSLRWHGCYRPRWHAREAFDALVSLCRHVGHLEPRSRLPALPVVKGSRFVGVRRMDEAWLPSLRHFLDGESDALLGRLFEALLERSGARMDRVAVQASLDTLKSFYVETARPLRDARAIAGWAERFVPQRERDALFIRARAARGAPRS
jgi:excinuclease ABC subunit C